jgi:HD-GYP domain-containing protein (c-di-GMP phosphodiesterase class II)
VTSPGFGAAPDGALRGGGSVDRADDSFIRRVGRQYISGMYAALRAIKLYPVENEAVQKALDELQARAAEILQRDGELEFRASRELIFINGTRVRLSLDNYASYSSIRSLLQSADIGSLRVAEGVAKRDWMVFLSQLQALPEGAEPAERGAILSTRLSDAGVKVFEFSPEAEADEETAAYQEKAKEAAKRTYAHSVAVTREVMSSARMGRTPSVKKIKRVVQSIVDQILADEDTIIGLTTLRDYDEYTFTHSVNVCIFSVALGRRLGLTRLQLYDLGIAALLHDIGKSRVPLAVLNKAGSLDDEEWKIMAAHPWLGVLSLFQMRGQQDLPYRAMKVAFEHHMRIDLSGYPKVVRPRELSILSKLVSVADGFDAATTRRAYQAEAWNPATVIQEMRDNPRRGMDPVVVKAFSNLLGVYPVGTLVVLDTLELALVHAASPNPEMMSRPIVRVVTDFQGNLLYPGELFDLSQESTPGTWLKSIIRTADPIRYGIRVSDYFV